MMVEGYRAHIGLQVGGVGMQVCGFPRFDQERREGERIRERWCMGRWHGMVGHFLSQCHAMMDKARVQV
jgi:hypothetical protein